MKKLITVILLLSVLSTFAQSPQTYNLIVGMEKINDAAYKKKYDKEFDQDATAGVPKDEQRMIKIANRNGNNITQLRNENATVENIKKAIISIGTVIKKGDTFIFYFSGHGDVLKDLNGDEKSGFDQTMVAYDDFLIDDDVYTLLNKYFRESKNIMIVDACHSATSYKLFGLSIDFKTLKNKKNKFLNETKALTEDYDSSLNEACNFGNGEVIDEPFNLIYFGATEDEKTATGDGNGGLLTIIMDTVINKALVAGNWNTYTYSKLACEIKKVMRQKKQNLQYHEIGKNVTKYSNQIPFKTI